MAIFQFFKMAAAVILDFQNLKILTVGRLKRVEMRPRAKFGRNLSNGGRDMAIFRFSKMAAAASLDFQNFKFSTVGCFKSVEVRRCAKFGQNRWNRCRDMATFIFPRWRPSAILDVLCGCLDHPWRVLGGLYHCAKFGLNQCSSFDNMQVLVFCDYGLKTPIHAPFSGFLEHMSPKKCHSSS